MLISPLSPRRPPPNIYNIEISCDLGNILLPSFIAEIQLMFFGKVMPNHLEPAAPHFDAPPETAHTAEAFIAEKRIGERIRRLRLKRSMGLVELGRLTGLSASFLSQLETGRVVPTLRNLARIAIVFGRDLSYFFEPEPHPLFRLHRRSERVRLPQSGVDHPTYYFESLAWMVPERQLDPYYAEFLPVPTAAEVRPHVHPGYEFLYVLQGELEIKHGERTHSLQSGDSVYFDAGTSHAYRCTSEQPAVALIVTMHQILPQLAAGARLAAAPRAAAPGSESDA